MAEAETPEKQVKPILPFLHVPENPDEKPYLAGSKCKSCGATYGWDRNEEDTGIPHDLVHMDIIEQFFRSHKDKHIRVSYTGAAHPGDESDHDQDEDEQ